LFLRN